ncbi:hypothetical protein, partial [Nocardia wallacei]|uniref:hypothetical protein n=1 Tax=Nocardia wallacei TaxID=480035 RepID=UPI002458F9CB
MTLDSGQKHAGMTGKPRRHPGDDLGKPRRHPGVVLAGMHTHMSVPYGCLAPMAGRQPSGFIQAS